MSKERPKSFVEALKMLTEIFPNAKKYAKGMTENEFTATVHHSWGRHIRNEWKLWVNEPGNKLTDWFTEHSINNGDDRSAIIFTSFWRMVNRKEIGLDEQKEKYLRHWKIWGEPGWKGIYPVQQPAE